MSKSRKPNKNVRSSKSGSQSSQKGLKSTTPGKQTKPSEKVRLIRLIALFVLVGSLGYLWFDRNKPINSDSASVRTNRSGQDSTSASERIRSLDGMTMVQLEQFLKIPSLEAEALKPAKIDIEMWTQQVDRDLDQLQQRQPNDAKVEHLVGLANLRLKRTKLAEPNLRHAVELDPANPQMRYDLADLLLQLGRDGEALEALQGIGRSVSNAQYLALTAECLMRQGELSEAQQSLSRATELAPDSAEIWVRLGKLQLQQRDFETAARSAKKATEVDGNFAEAWLLLSQTSKLLKNSDQASQAIQRWNELQKPKQHHAEDRDFELENSQSMANVFGSVFRSLGAIYEDKSELVTAAQMYSRASQVCPDDCENVLAKAGLFRRAGQFAEAADLMRRAIRLQSKDYMNYQNFANLAMEQKLPNQAEAALRLACLAMPENGKAQLTLARFLLLANKPSEAIAVAQSAERMLKSEEAAEVLSQALSAAGVRP